MKEVCSSSFQCGNIFIHSYRGVARNFVLGCKMLVSIVDYRNSTFSAISRSLSCSWDDLLLGFGVESFYVNHYDSLFVFVSVSFLILSVYDFIVNK